MPRTSSRKNSRSRPDAASGDPMLDAQTRRWILRLLVPLQGYRKFFTKDYIREDELAYALGLGEWVDEDKFDREVVLKLLREQHQEAERQLAETVDDRPLCRNLDRLSRLIRLTPAERAILELAAVEANDSVLSDAMGLLGDISLGHLYRTLARLLGQKEAEIQAALSPWGLLVRSGLLSYSKFRGTRSLNGTFSLLSDRFADVLLTREAQPEDLLDTVVSASPAPSLTLDDYVHVRPWLDTLIPYLRQAFEEHRCGVNVLLYGRPGTGKTELSRVLGQVVQARLFDVCIEDGDGNAIGGDERLRAYRTAQFVFAQSERPLLVFDEADDVFAGAGRFLPSHRSETEISKAWVNRLLEDNAVPTVWISNTVACIDPAYMRRFDLVIEVPVLPRRQRSLLIEDIAGDLLGREARERLSDIEQLPPALLTRAIRVVQVARAGERQAASSNDPGTAIERLIGSTLKACGKDSNLRGRTARLPDTYDPALSCADADLPSLAEGLARAGAARLCLYGPPGTGKTAWASWLARSLNRPLLIRRASDLLSMWVGGSEKQIAEAFEEARRDGAVLLIDEVDSFLQDRRGAHYSWEMTQVNEVLTQMESFDGVFVASTNLMDNLDSAALRRFDVKICFRYLRPPQAHELYRRYAGVLGLPEPAEWVLHELDTFTTLAPGDFAVLARLHRFRPFATHEAAMDALRNEQALKSDRKTKIGFV